MGSSAITEADIEADIEVTTGPLNPTAGGSPDASPIARILGPRGLVAASLPGYESRPGQLAMAERIAEAIDRDDRLFVEAGTGTGKTLAYLVPALLSGRKVVVSTGTKTLQDQIARVDLPRLRSILPQPFEWSVMKGLGNYLCLRRFEEQTRQGALVANPELERIREWAARTASGDRADLSELPDDSPLWREVSATPETRLGARCPYFERCFVTGMRRRALDAQLVIVNHHLFFADLALRSAWPEAQVLPPYEVVIFDEAHQIEEIATEFFGMHVSTQRVFALARDLGRAIGLDVLRANSASTRLLAAGRALGEALRDHLPVPRAGADEVRVPVPDGPVGWRAAGALPRARRRARRDRDLARLRRRGGARGPQRRRARLASAGARRRCATSWGRWSIAGRAARVRWVAATARNVSLHASPIDVGPALARSFDLVAGPLIFTSATLTVAGSFDYVRTRIGLRRRRLRGQLRVAVSLRRAGAAVPGGRSARAQRRPLSAGRRRARRRAVRDHRGTRAAAVHQLPQPAHRRGPPARDAAVPACWCRASGRVTCCWRRCASASARCCWRRRASGRGSTSPARRCRWW